MPAVAVQAQNKNLHGVWKLNETKKQEINGQMATVSSYTDEGMEEPEK